MMRVLLFVLFVFPIVVCGQLDIFNPQFKDPFSNIGPLLDIYVLVCEAWPSSQLDAVTVTVPTTASSTNPNTGYFRGPAFSHSISGVTARIGALSSPSTLTVEWNGIDTFTFRGFLGSSAGDAVVQTPYAGDKIHFNWVNVNFDIPDTVFIDPRANTGDWNSAFTPGIENMPGKVPLVLVPFDASSTTNPKIAQVADNLFDAVPSEILPTACKGGQGVGDPVFSGFQGQNFQFHGLPDEHFNLVSSPDVQLNAHFVYLSSGKCDYNDTECYTHPGTYMDVLGFSIIDTHIKLVAGTHDVGLRVWLNDQEIPRGTHVKQFTNTSAHIKYHHNGHVEIHTEIMNFDIVNSDMFMNVHVALNNRQLLRVGAKRHTVTDAIICKTNTETHNHQLIETTVAAKYPVNTPLHGLIGQTWRNVKVCSKDWMGTVEDYITSDLFASDYHYNYFKW